jgi:hypothetical protein
LLSHVHARWENSVIRCKACGSPAAVSVSVPMLGYVPMSANPVGMLSWFPRTEMWWAISFAEAKKLGVAPECTVRDLVCPGREFHDLGSPVSEQRLPFCIGISNSHDRMLESMEINTEPLLVGAKEVVIPMAPPSASAWPITEGSEGLELWSKR